MPAARDAVVVGAGHNGLTAAWYLARAGLAVTVLERRPIVGGAAVTETFHPGFRNSTASYTVGLLAPEVIRDMELRRHGLEIRLRPVSNWVPSEDGRCLAAYPDREATLRSIAEFSQADAERYGEYVELIESVAAPLRELARRAPPDPAGGWRDVLSMLGQARLARRMSREALEAFAALVGGSAGEFLDDRFETDALKALLGFDAIVGHDASPYAPGTGYVLLHHVFGETLGQKGAWGHAVGGMGAITEAMARACRERGVEIETGRAVARIVTRDGRTTGVELECGERYDAPVVLAAVNPRLMVERLLAPEDVPAGFAGRMRRWRCGSAVLRINVALDALPAFTALEGLDRHKLCTAGIVLAPSLTHMDRAWRESRERGWSSTPVVEMLIPSTLDDTLAPPGRHVASLFCQYFPAELPNDQDWTACRTRAVEDVLDWVSRFAPGFRGSVLGLRALTPLDLERELALVGGDIFHGAMRLDQLWAFRPALGHADHRMPVPGLYLAGAGAHPGGGVTGLPGRGAARAVLADRRRPI